VKDFLQPIGMLGSQALKDGILEESPEPFRHCDPILGSDQHVDAFDLGKTPEQLLQKRFAHESSGSYLPEFSLVRFFREHPNITSYENHSILVNIRLMLHNFHFGVFHDVATLKPQLLLIRCCSLSTNNWLCNRNALVLAKQVFHENVSGKCN